MFPVGFLSNMFVSSPILDGAGNFKGFYDGWAGNRTFMVDMAGFAVNVEYFTEVIQYKSSLIILSHYESTFRKLPR